MAAGSLIFSSLDTANRVLLSCLLAAIVTPIFVISARPAGVRYMARLLLEVYPGIGNISIVRWVLMRLV